MSLLLWWSCCDTVQHYWKAHLWTLCRGTSTVVLLTCSACGRIVSGAATPSADCSAGYLGMPIALWTACNRGTVRCRLRVVHWRIVAETGSPGVDCGGCGTVVLYDIAMWTASLTVDIGGSRDMRQWIAYLHITVYIQESKGDILNITFLEIIAWPHCVFATLLPLVCRTTLSSERNAVLAPFYYQGFALGQCITVTNTVMIPVTLPLQRTSHHDGCK